MSNLILYDDKSPMLLHTDLGTVWLTQLEIAELFQTTKQNIAKHLKTIFAEQDQSPDAVVNQRLTTAASGANCRIVRDSLDDIWRSSIWNALRSILRETCSSLHLPQILYTPCRKLPSSVGHGNCQQQRINEGSAP